MVRLPARLTGAFLLAGSCGTTLIHREIWTAAHHGPARTIEFEIGLLTFVLASAGVLLLIHGRKLFHRRNHRSGDVPQPETPLTSRLIEPIALAGRALDTRGGVAMMQARHAIAAARRDRARSVADDAGHPVCHDATNHHRR